MPHKTLAAGRIALPEHGTKHIFDKEEGRLDYSPTPCARLLHETVYWLMRGYLAPQAIEFRRERFALDFLAGQRML